MRWLDPSWRAEAEEWIRERVDVTGSIEQPHVYPWSTVLRVSTAEGPLWFKATTPEVHGFEPRLTEILAETCPDRVTELVEIDDDRAWMLMRDGGNRLRELEPPDLSLWEGILPRYAELQIAVTPRADELLTLGVPDMRPAGIPDAVEGLLEDDHALMVGESEELRRDQRDELACGCQSFARSSRSWRRSESPRRSSTTTSTTDRSSFRTDRCESSTGATAASRTRSTR